MPRQTQEKENEFYRELIEYVLKRRPAKNELSKRKNILARKHGLRKAPTDIEILMNAPSAKLHALKRHLLTKPTRTISGVAPVALMTKPIACKHGKCTFCPGGPDSYFGDVPMSYTGNEPSTMRAIRNRYNAYLIAFNRLEQYVLLGHSTDKVEAIIMGGTFPSFDKRYQESYIRDMYQAFNDFSKLFIGEKGLSVKRFREFFELPAGTSDKEREKKLRKKILGIKRPSTLEKEKKRNEKSGVRCVALCLETRPDYAKPRHINQMLRLGTTRVELGVQSTFEEARKKTNRCHTVGDSINSTRWLKDSLLKVGYHMMLGLPGVSPEQDLESLREIFENPDFRPDALKVYPCMVMPGTPLERQYRKGQFRPITTEEASGIIAKFKRHVPRYVRIMRVQRDIPTKVTVAGVDRTNLRQYVENKAANVCECIRCREPKNTPVSVGNARMNRLVYEASRGTEVFLSFDDMKEDKLLGFLRLRIPHKPFRHEFGKRTAGIRELHVYGQALPIGSHRKEAVQHKGLGKRLVKEAERIAREEFSMNDILVISGVGAREYYRKLGYRLRGAYMGKKL